jgi:hypothetical protein
MEKITEGYYRAKILSQSPTGLEVGDKETEFVPSCDLPSIRQKLAFRLRPLCSAVALYYRVME